MTQNVALCRDAIALVMDYNRDPRYPNDPNEYQLSPLLQQAVASDAARWIGEEVILTYDWCHSHFTDAERVTARTLEQLDQHSQR